MKTENIKLKRHCLDLLIRPINQTHSFLKIMIMYFPITGISIVAY